jgi:hypothetical protein
MNSMNFDELVQLQVLKHKASLSGPSFLIDKLVDEHPELRQMCAKVHPSDRPPRSSDEPAGHEQARIHRSCCV